MQAPSDTIDLVAGFSDVVMQSQETFRAVLDAMARPGTIVTCGTDDLPPAKIHSAAAAFFLTVADFETPVWYAGELADSAFSAWLRFHCSSPVAQSPDEAAFALIHAAGEGPALSDFAQGSEGYPDRSTTVVIQVDSLQSGSTVRLTGPGIETQTALSVNGLHASFWDAWRRNTDRFPCGVDLILTAGTRMVALPRTTRVET